MKRAHLFELEDQAWFPPALRDLLTTSLQFGATRLGFYSAVAPLVARLLASSSSGEVIDLCSGGTGPWLRLREQLAELGHEVRITFTDLHASAEARAVIEALGDPSLRYRESSIDARAVPADLRGVRTLFTGFHHFAPADARLVLADAVQARAPMGIFEFTERSLASCAIATLVPLAMLLTTPLIRPFSLARYALTYALPVLPLCNLWDGVVSNLRTYTLDEMRALAASIESDYTWEAGRLEAHGPGPRVSYLIGIPGAQSTARAAT